MKLKKSRNLRVLIAHHRWWFPTAVSGADIANQELALQLISRGVSVRVQGILPPSPGSRTTIREYQADGVPVCLATSDFTKRIEKTIEEFQPNVVLTSCPEPNCGKDEISRMVDLFAKHNLPVVLYVHDIESTLPLFEDAKDKLASIVTNSSFMAQNIQDIWSRDADVVYPVPERKKVLAAESEGSFITFFNPKPEKGLSIAHDLVKERLTDRPFLFVEGFIDPEARGIFLSRSGNLVHARRSPDVATIYMMTNTLIVPSQWDEPFGRVALEGMYNRIPVIASKKGGLMESVGDGGILIEDYTSVDAWAEAILSLDDPQTRAALIEKGSRHAKKFQVEKEIDKLVEILEDAG